MNARRCIPCSGSGKVMGGGFMIANCEYCDGSGKIKYVDDEIDYLAMKQTESYRNAKARLKSKHNSLSDEDAEKLLDEAFEKELEVEKPKAKRGRKKKKLV